MTFPSDLLPAPREWAERWFEVTHWRAFTHGGHFPAWEVPDALAQDLREFARTLSP